MQEQSEALGPRHGEECDKCRIGKLLRRAHTKETDGLYQMPQGTRPCRASPRRAEGGLDVDLRTPRAGPAEL
jgi:hypothetical protein